MRLTLFTAVALSLVSGLLPGCSRPAPERQTGGSASSGESAAGAATGQASEGSTDDRNAPARPASK
ncbi:MAG: hypothetical protein EPO20_27765 [Betaproteobacteria bacterium]|nr:MAG: hypothetical protein EPO20_27765 [Betaproteobacteria bacterium]